MQAVSGHTFHIPVMGLGFTIDTPVKVARYGISSVISIVDDILIEGMRRHYYTQIGEPYTPITDREEDFRARRITDYLNLVARIVARQCEEMRTQPFGSGGDIDTYFALLPDSSPLKAQYRHLLLTDDAGERAVLDHTLRSAMRPGAIDVNIMTKLDKVNFAARNEALPPEFTDALAALRGFAHSTLESSIVLSAGMNTRLYAYMERFPDFYPDEHGTLCKRIILKVSDYRSASIQGRLLAKKGLWVSEYRIESGLNCGGHAFATEGLLLGPILREFRDNRDHLYNELAAVYTQALAARSIGHTAAPPPPRITVQGGIGTAEEHAFLLEHYHVDAAGWGSPFLLVPEATNVDPDTLQRLASARRSDYYMSRISPLGVPFNTVHGTSSEEQKLARIQAGKPGSPCVKKYLVSNTEFTTTPLCTASRRYQALKIRQLEEQHLQPEEYQREYGRIVEKDCLCEGLAASALINADAPNLRRRAVLVCPGPNLGFFSGVISLADMIGHIYGRLRLPMQEERPHVFINELRIYIDYLQHEVEEYLRKPAAAQKKYLDAFRENLRRGIDYYRRLASETTALGTGFAEHLHRAEHLLDAVPTPEPACMAP